MKNENSNSIRILHFIKGIPLWLLNQARSVCWGEEQEGTQWHYQKKRRGNAWWKDVLVVWKCVAINELGPKEGSSSLCPWVCTFKWHRQWGLNWIIRGEGGREGHNNKLRGLNFTTQTLEVFALPNNNNNNIGQSAHTKGRQPCHVASRTTPDSFVDDGVASAAGAAAPTSTLLHQCQAN